MKSDLGSNYGFKIQTSKSKSKIDMSTSPTKKKIADFEYKRLVKRVK